MRGDTSAAESRGGLSGEQTFCKEKKLFTAVGCIFYILINLAIAKKKKKRTKNFPQPILQVEGREASGRFSASGRSGKHVKKSEVKTIEQEQGAAHLARDKMVPCGKQSGTGLPRPSRTGGSAGSTPVPTAIPQPGGLGTEPSLLRSPGSPLERRKTYV